MNFYSGNHSFEFEPCGALYKYLEEELVLTFKFNIQRNKRYKLTHPNSFPSIEYLNSVPLQIAAK